MIRYNKIHFPLTHFVYQIQDPQPILVIILISLKSLD